MKNKLDRTEQTLKIPLLDIDVRNEQAFLVFSIIATVLTVRTYSNPLLMNPLSMNATLTLPMLRRLSSKAHICKDF